MVETAVDLESGGDVEAEPHVDGSLALQVRGRVARPAVDEDLPPALRKLAMLVRRQVAAGHTLTEETLLGKYGKHLKGAFSAY